MTLKSLAKSLLRPLPQWAPVGIFPPQQAVSVWIVWEGNRVDVTRNHTIASLKPLTVAVGLNDALQDIVSAILIYQDVATGRQIGSLKISRVAIRNSEGISIGLFQIDGGDQRCLAWPRRPWNAWLQSRAIRRNKNPHNFYMDPAAVQQLMIFYMCPRPVVLVSVSEEAHSNIFPMDLIGPLENDCFTLALRATSISVPTICNSRRIAISGMRAEHKGIVYKLGEHHKREFADWSALPFPVVLTEKFELPAIESALCVRELAVKDCERIGSHMFFICRIVSERQLAQGLQLHHTAGFHQEYRRKKGEPFVPA